MILVARYQIQDLLLSGTDVLVDRYSPSGLAFSGANINVQMLKAVEYGLPQPDITFYLDIDPKVTSKRAGFGDER